MIVSKYTVHVDWYQVTVKFAEVDARQAYELNAYRTVNYALDRVLGADICELLFSQHVGSGSGYEYRYKNKETFESGARIYHGGHEHCLVVLTGQACQKLQSDHPGMLDALVERTSDICSRIDLAATMWTETGVDEYVGDAARDMARYPSQSGTTYYAGSRQSDAYSRIYQYNPPHPRAGTIRVEHEYKGKAAKACAAALTHSDIEGIVKQRGQRKGLNMDFMESKPTKIVVGENRAKSAERTIHWLSTSVAAAVRRLIDEGNLTPDEVFEILIEPNVEKGK